MIGSVALRGKRTLGAAHASLGLNVQAPLCITSDLMGPDCHMP
jgi:hypothetical protein